VDDHPEKCHEEDRDPGASERDPQPPGRRPEGDRDDRRLEPLEENPLEGGDKRHRVKRSPGATTIRQPTEEHVEGRGLVAVRSPARRPRNGLAQPREAEEE
jgi:hypothetical protein